MNFENIALFPFPEDSHNHTHRLTVERGILLRNDSIARFGWQRQFTPEFTRELLWGVELWENNNLLRTYRFRDTQP